jgi:small-conductance mechanosensitive channel
MNHLADLDDLERWLRPDTFVGAIAYLVLFCLLAGVLSRALRIAIATAVSHAPVEHVDRTAVNFLRQLGVLIIWVFVLAAYAHLIPALRSLGTAMLAGASIASIVLGLAAQNTLGNLVAGISILIYRPFRLGDLLQLSGPTGPEIGTVEALSLGYTILGTQDGRRVIVPNSLAITQIVINLNAFAREGTPALSFWVARADLVRARTAALDFARSLGAQGAGCFVTKTETAAVQLSLSFRTVPADTERVQAANLPAQLAEALKRDGIVAPAGKDGPTLAPG